MPRCVEFSPSPNPPHRSSWALVLHVSAARTCSIHRFSSAVRWKCNQDSLVFAGQFCHLLIPGHIFFSVIGKGLGWIITSIPRTCCLILPHIKTLVISASRCLSAAESSLFSLLFCTLLTVSENDFLTVTFIIYIPEMTCVVLSPVSQRCLCSKAR